MSENPFEGLFKLQFPENMIQFNTLDLVIESDNKFKNQKSMGVYWKYKRYKQDWERLIKAKFPKIERVQEFRIVEITRIYSGRERPYDYGNLVGGCKPILDLLKEQGHIWNDSPKWLKEVYSQMKGHKSYTMISISREEKVSK